MSDGNNNSGPEEAIKGVVEDVKGKARQDNAEARQKTFQ